MSFANPWAFLALLAIPLLIIIYIIKNKYREDTDPSIYLWELSRKFLKRKNPISRIEHLINLIVQIVCIFCMSFALASPTFTLKGKADNIVFVLDTSASMNLIPQEDNEKGLSRFEQGVEEIRKIASDAKRGSLFTLVSLSDTPEFVCTKVSSLDQFNLYLDSVKASSAASDLTSAIALAQKMYTEEGANLCYLATDQKIEENQLENISLIDVSSSDINYAIPSLSYTYGGGKLSLNAQFISYESDQQIRFYIYVNEKPVSGGGYFTCDLKKGEATPYEKELDISEMGDVDISSVRITISSKDALELDNTYIAYQSGEKNTKARVLIVSENSTHLVNAFNAIKNISYKTVAPESYSPQSGYDITVFDGYTPSTLPNSGAVWFFAPSASIQGAGFYASSEEYDAKNGAVLSYANNDDDILYRQLTKGTYGNQISLSKYYRCSLMGDFTTLMTYDNIPMIFAGKNEKGQRQAVFSFRLKDTSLPSTPQEYIPLIRNLISYSSPKLLTTYNFTLGEKVTFPISDTLEDLAFKTPEGNTLYQNTDGLTYLEYQFTMVGTYEISYQDGNEKNKFVIFVSFPKEEGKVITADENSYSLLKDTNSKKADGIFDSLIPYIILIAIFFGADWILYTHEQY